MGQEVRSKKINMGRELKSEKINLGPEPEKELLMLWDLMAHGTHGCFRSAWPSLKPIIDRIYDGSLLEDEEYMSGYMIIYRASSCPKCLEAFFWKYQSTLIDYLNFKVLHELENKEGKTLLHEFLRQYESYKSLDSELYKIFHYLDGYKLVVLPSLETTSRHSFNDVVFKEMRTRVRDALLAEIEKERNGKEIDHALMKNVLEIFLDLSDYAMYYELHFESKMIEETATFYSKKAIHWLDLHSYRSYMKNFFDAMEDEGKRVGNYMNSTSWAKLEQVLKRELLEVHARKISELKELSESYEKQKFAKMCNGGNEGF